ncbi:hypothetical protein EIP91_006358 [Steccherinum ochraceum]|uniref:Uncharacterized protein n=1 Tax=Steccherinum ochraceum TaxID=92696 RepID=A0A4R0RBQ6_9APHY|nr:hypothetical protein EIP91_006358 [Steccherinum ochraceum]
MNANSLNYPATLVQGLLSPPSQGAVHDDPYRDLSFHSDSHFPPSSRPSSLVLPRRSSPSGRPLSFQYLPDTQRRLSAQSMDPRARPHPQAYLDDPAFSSDPEENPHFSMSSLGEFLPANPSALDVHASMQDNLYAHQGLARDRSAGPPQHLRAHTSVYDPQLPQSVYSSHPRSRSHASPLPPPRAPPSNDTWTFRPFDDPLDDFPYSERDLAPASNTFLDAKPRSHSNSRSRSHSHYQQDVSPTSSASSSPITPSLSLESAPSSISHSSYSHTSYSQSAYSHSSHSHSSHSHSDSSHGSAGLSKKLPPKKAPPAEPIVLLPPPAYSALPPPTDRPLPVTTASAPEIRQPWQPATDAPPRPTSVPAPKPSPPQNPIARPSELRKQRSRKTSAAPPLGGLDKIDELDETDPLGFAWHHDSRYEGVKKATDTAEAGANGGKDVAKALLDKDHAERKKHKKSSSANPNTTSFSISPGQIFPAFNAYHPQHTELPTLQRRAPAAQPPPQPPLRSSSSPSIPEISLQPPQPPSSSLLQPQLPPQSFHRHASSHSVQLEQQSVTMTQALMPAPPSRPASIHSQSSTQSLPPGTELAYAQPLPNPHPPNRAQTPPRHRLSRMTQDMVAVASATVAPAVNGAPFPTDPTFNPVFAQQPAQGTPYGMNNGPPPAPQQQSIYRASSGASSHSSHSSRTSRPPAPGLPPRLQQQQQMNSIPRPDIVLPPRHQAAKNRAQPQQPHYLPKRLVMPTPLQAQPNPQQQQVQGMPSYSGSPGDPMGPEYAGRPSPDAASSARQAQAKKAKEIPMASGGRNLLRKRATVSGSGSSPPGSAAPDGVMVGGAGAGAGNVVNGMQVVGNGSGPAYIPSSNASAAMFASKAGGSGSGSGSSKERDARTEWEMKQRQRELQKEREREWKREMAIDSQMQKEREREREREREKEREKGGRKLSKRR